MMPLNPSHRCFAMGDSFGDHTGYWNFGPVGPVPGERLANGSACRMSALDRILGWWEKMLFIF
jgi:hypothetical protein